MTSGSTPQETFHHRVCPLCVRDNSAENPSTFSRPPWLIKKCSNCGFVYLENTLRNEQLEEEHAWTDSCLEERKRRREAEPIFSRVSHYWRRTHKTLLKRPEKALRLIRRFVPTGRFLDVGCGRANILKRIDPKLNAYGIEIDSGAAQFADEFARARGGRVIHADAINGLKQFDDDTFDGVLMRSYLEHEVQPDVALAETQRTLRPGQYAIIKVPNFASLNRHIRGNKWCGFRFPDHVNYFEPATLAALTERAGLKVHKFGLLDHNPVSDSLWLVARKAA